jgi:CRISPR-associated protein (TIGR03986 family)
VEVLLMEKGKLIIGKSKKGKLIVKIEFIDTGKKMDILHSNIKDNSFNGAEVDVIREKGEIVKIKFGDKLLYENPKFKVSSIEKKINPEGGKVMEHIEDIQNSARTARASYNFIPLNEQVVESNYRPDLIDFSKYHTDRNTGWIALKIETKTPLYIRDTLNDDEMKKEEETKKKGKTFKHSDFFSPGGKIRIPGSSLRGMVRNLIEIVSFGKFGFFDDKRLYFRGLADQSNLRKEYQKIMSSLDRDKFKMSAGILVKKNLSYFIKPATKFFQISQEKAKKIVREIGETYKEFEYYELKDGYLVVPGHMKSNAKFEITKETINDLKDKIDYNKLNIIKALKDVKHSEKILIKKLKDGGFSEKEIDITFNYVKNNIKDWYIINPANDVKEIPISEEDVINYNNDITRGKNVPNLIKKLKVNPAVPCFYTKLNNKISFGHTAYFRIAYESTIGDMISIQIFKIDDNTIKKLKDNIIDEKLEELKKHKNKKVTKKELLQILKNSNFKEEEIKIIYRYAMIIDICEAIFGNSTDFTGRVFFEDAFLEETDTHVLLEKETPQILSSPKPTTFQHYLVQTSEDIKKLNHYNTPKASIRGYKLYWHKSGEKWVETEKEKIKDDDKQYTEIKPVRKGEKFIGKIRFENLSDIELGALLFVLDLPEGHCHKMGMGKPLGLGSIKLTPKLFLSDRQERYKSFFSDLDPKESTKIADLKHKFEEYILKNIERHNQNLWDIPRLMELKTMLNFDGGVQLEGQNKTNYMQLQEFKERPILPKPSQV